MIETSIHIISQEISDNYNNSCYNAIYTQLVPVSLGIALGCEYQISSLNKHVAVISWKINNCFLIITQFLNECFWFMIEMVSKHDYVGAIYLQIPRTI